MQLKEVLALMLQDFIETERQAKPTPASLQNSFRDAVVGFVFQFIENQDWQEIAKQNREEREHDA